MRHRISSIWMAKFTAGVAGAAGTWSDGTLLEKWVRRMAADGTLAPAIRLGEASGISSSPSPSVTLDDSGVGMAVGSIGVAAIVWIYFAEYIWANVFR